MKKSLAIKFNDNETEDFDLIEKYKELNKKCDEVITKINNKKPRKKKVKNG